jgi:hypothetical protein
MEEGAWPLVLIFREVARSWLKVFRCAKNPTLFTLAAQAAKLVPGAGVEPALPFENKILSLACLPISPPGQSCSVVKLERRVV